MIDFYKTKKWASLRSAVLRRDGYICQVSKRYGKIVPANTVHHIFPREDFPKYQCEMWNLVSVSKEVHNRLHDRLTDALTNEGIELLKRTARKNNIDIPLRYR